MIFVLAGTAVLIGIFNLKEVTRLDRQFSTQNVSDQNTSAIITPGIPNTGTVRPGESGRPQTQDDLVTAAVERVSPAVVSVVISKKSPQKEVEYVNPFGNDPLLKNFNFKIPVYREQGIINQKLGTGSGFIISHAGHILTNKHVVDDLKATFTVELIDGTEKEAEVVYRDPNNDIAILKIPGTYNQIASLGDSASVKLGQTVVAIGNALGEYGNSVSVGIISGLNRTVQAYDMSGTTSEELKGVFQTDASINLGNSGGPLIDLNGNVIGVNVATIYGSNNISFSIPVNSIKDIVEKY